MIENRNLPAEANPFDPTLHSESKEELLGALLPSLTGYLHKKTDNQWVAEDLASRTTLKALEALPKYQNRGLPFAAWVFRIAYNEFVDHTRQTKPTSRIYHENGDPISALQTDFEDEFLDNCERDQKLQEIQQHMGSLSATQQKIISFRFFAELTTKDTAAILGKSETYINKEQSLGIAKLRKLTNIKAYQPLP